LNLSADSEKRSLAQFDAGIVVGFVGGAEFGAIIPAVAKTTFLLGP
jgi:hypothetical protein